MTSLKKLLQGVKILAVILTCSVFLFLQNAIAASESDCLIPPTVNIENGEFDLNNLPIIDIPKPLRIASAVVSLPEGETGLIEQIKITNTSLPMGENEIEFGCVNLKVQNGTDLIKSCGGPAYLKAGNTKYEAKGSKFNPESKVAFSIKLCE